MTCVCFWTQKTAKHYTTCISGGSRPGVWGGSQIGGRQEGLHLLKYQSLSATIVGCNTKVVTFCRPKSGCFCWFYYAIFQGKITVWKRFISLIQGLKRVPNSGPCLSQATQISFIYKMYLKGIKAWCAQAFAIVLVIRSEISEEQCLKRISDLVRSTTVFLRRKVTTHVPR